MRRTKANFALRRTRALGLGAVAVFLIQAPEAISAVTSHARQVRITQLYVYPDYGGGDVTAVLDDPIPGCEAGVWISPSSPGFKAAFATLLMLQNTGGLARIWVHDDQLWPGSSGRHCKVHTINPVR